MARVLKVFNTLTRRKEVFRSLKRGRVSMFVCGPTVQSLIHLGHARTYIFYDVVARYLASLGYDVEYLMNVTDVDERITHEAKKFGTSPTALARRFAKLFLEDMAALDITSVRRFEPVSPHVGEMMKQVEALLRKGRAYVVGGWVYFDTSTFRSFGRLSHQSRKELSLRPLELSTQKRNLLDFALWRPEALVEGKWKSPWGMGSPGWHIQDTALTLSLLGPQYDIHGGAYELIYPHHEAEIAQAESLTGRAPVVKYWVHTSLVNMKGEKMSKSLGNVFTVRDALKRYSADELRLFFLSTHYRKDMDLKGLEEAAARLTRLRETAGDLAATTGMKFDVNGVVPASFTSAMNDDFDTPRAIEAVEALLRLASQKQSLRERASDLASAASAMSLLGVDLLG